VQLYSFSYEITLRPGLTIAYGSTQLLSYVEIAGQLVVIRYCGSTVHTLFGIKLYLKYKI
jgi:hypothetical protein